MANTAVTTPSAFEQINSLSQLTIVRQIGLMVILAASVALGIAVVMWSRATDYTPLYMSLSTQDSSEIVNALEQNGTSYKINIASGIISVPANEVQQVRMHLASLGLPRSSSNGYDILGEEQALGTSNFLEQARFHRALEQELVATIRYIQGVREARVHLSIPRQTSFVRSSNKSSASVMLDLISPQSLSETQIAGIVHLVASSVSGLDPEKVSVVDQRGSLLSKRSGSEFNDSSEHIRYVRNLEENYSERILNLLSPVVGAENIRAQVSADIDFTVVETTSENFNPNTVAIRSEQIVEENMGNSNSSATTPPGTLSPVAPIVEDPIEAEESQSTTTQSRTNSTRNYEVDHVISRTKTVPGVIQRLSVAVLVDLSAQNTVDGEAQELDAEALQNRVDRITQLVKDSIGFNAARGDSVNVINEQFSPIIPLPEVPPQPIWEQPWVFSIAKQLGAGFVVLLIIFGVLSPALKKTIDANNEKTIKVKQIPGEVNVNNIGDDTVSISGEIEAPPSPPQKSEYDENLSMAQSLVANEPTRAARQLKEWVNGE